MNGLMKAVARGARGVMRVYTRGCCDKSRTGGGLAKGYVRELELRQLSIGEFVVQATKFVNTPKRNGKDKDKPVKLERKCAPPVEALAEFERGGIGLVGWNR